MRRYDYSKLRGKIKEKLGTEGIFANKIGRTQNFVSKVFNNGTYFGQEDIARSAEILGIPVNEIGIYFFTSEVHKKETLKWNDIKIVLNRLMKRRNDARVN